MWDAPLMGDESSANRNGTALNIEIGHNEQWARKFKYNVLGHSMK